MASSVELRMTFEELCLSVEATQDECFELGLYLAFIRFRRTLLAIPIFASNRTQGGE